MDKEIRRRIIVSFILLFVQILLVLFAYYLLRICIGDFGVGEKPPEICMPNLFGISFLFLIAIIITIVGFLAVIFTLVILLKSIKADKYKITLVIATILEILLPILLFVMSKTPRNSYVTLDMFFDAWLILFLVILFFSVLCIVKIIKKDYDYVALLIFNAVFFGAYVIATIFSGILGG